jgi:WhiB family transcriptional regulator, redox-sensing transcriptional regulator
MDVAFGNWWDEAACRGQDASFFFAPSYFEKRGEKLAREAVAKSFCTRCPVRDECLEFALESRDPHGVWGGMNEMERRALLRRRIAAEQREAS